MAPDQPRDSLDALGVAARQLQDAGTVEDLLQLIVDTAVATVEGCTYAGVSTARDGRPQSPVVSHPAVLGIDALQYTLNEGPCLSTMEGPDTVVESADLERDARFEVFGPEAARQGCRAVMAHRLYVDSRTLGSLNLYSTTANSYTDEDRRRGSVLAALVSIALNALLLEAEREGLREAVRSRDLIGQAKGILMQRDGLSADHAFDKLRQMSNDQNVKLRDVAQHIVDTRESSEGV